LLLSNNYSIIVKCVFYHIKTKEGGKTLKNSTVYYGATFLDEKDLVETNITNNIELEYYRTENCKTNILKKEKTSYGIEIIKREYILDDVKVEKSRLEDISTNAKKVINIIESLRMHKVTPIGLQDVVCDLLKQKKF